MSETETDDTEPSMLVVFVVGWVLITTQAVAFGNPPLVSAVLTAAVGLVTFAALAWWST